MLMPPTPEHDKLKAVIDSGERDAVQRFLDWLYDEKKYRVTHLVQLGAWGDEDLIPIKETREELMAEFFGVDLQKLSQEKQALLGAIRASDQP